MTDSIETKIDDAPQLPPFPTPLFEWSEEEIKSTADMIEPQDDNEAQLRANIAHKMTWTWNLYADLVRDERLVEIINKPAKPECDKHYLQQKVCFVVDQLGKLLSKTHPLREIAYLQRSAAPDLARN